MMPILVRDYVAPGKAFIVNREFPLMMIADHKHAKAAAVWATAAARVGKYKEAAGALFRGQGTWNVTGKVAETVLPVVPAADQKKVQALARDPSIEQAVMRDVAAANAARVNQTPTLIIRRGTKSYTFAGPGPENYMLLRSLLDGLLK
jgi:protein-disulfide isomerase